MGDGVHVCGLGEIVTALSGLSTLKSLHFREFRWFLDETGADTRISFPRSLEHFSFRLKHPRLRTGDSMNPYFDLPGPDEPTWSGVRRDPGDSGSAQAIAALLSIACSTLVSVSIAGQVCSLPALEKLAWPKLKHLTFVGSPILLDEDVKPGDCPPIISILAAAPQLETLKVRFAIPNRGHSIYCDSMRSPPEPEPDPFYVYPSGYDLRRRSGSEKLEVDSPSHELTANSDSSTSPTHWPRLTPITIKGEQESPLRSPSSPSSRTYSFVALPGNAVKKRPRQRYDEIERLYQCSFPDCNKSYGTLNHLNAHVTMQKHGTKRSPNGKLILSAHSTPT